MPFYRMHGLMVHLKLSGKAAKNPPAPCCAPIELDDIKQRCMAISGVLCDFELESGTCDAPLCEEHAHQVGPDRHLCPRHAAARAAAEPELF